jgi:hypothetical protein
VYQTLNTDSPLIAHLDDSIEFNLIKIEFPRMRVSRSQRDRAPGDLNKIERKAHSRGIHNAM